MAEQSVNKSSAMNHAMIAGLELGFWLGVQFILEAQSLKHPSISVFGTFITLYIFWGVYVSTQHYKQTECDGKLSWSVGYRYILCLYACASLIASVIRFVYMQWFDPSYLTAIYEKIEPIMKEVMKSEYDENAIKTLFIPIRYTVINICSDMMHGIIFGPIIALIAHRRDMKYFKNTQN